MYYFGGMFNFGGKKNKKQIRSDICGTGLVLFFPEKKYWFHGTCIFPQREIFVQFKLLTFQ